MSHHATRQHPGVILYQRLAWQAADRGDAHSAALYVRQARALQYAWEKRGEVPGTKQFRWYNTDTKETRRQISEPGTSGRGKRQQKATPPPPAQQQQQDEDHHQQQQQHGQQGHEREPDEQEGQQPSREHRPQTDKQRKVAESLSLMQAIIEGDEAAKLAFVDWLQDNPGIVSKQVAKEWTDYLKKEREGKLGEHQSPFRQKLEWHLEFKAGKLLRQRNGGVGQGDTGEVGSYADDVLANGKDSKKAVLFRNKPRDAQLGAILEALGVTVQWADEPDRRLPASSVRIVRAFGKAVEHLHIIGSPEGEFVERLKRTSTVAARLSDEQVQGLLQEAARGGIIRRGVSGSGSPLVAKGNGNLLYWKLGEFARSLAAGGGGGAEPPSPPEGGGGGGGGAEPPSPPEGGGGGGGDDDDNTIDLSQLEPLPEDVPGEDQEAQDLSGAGGDEVDEEHQEEMRQLGSLADPEEARAKISLRLRAAMDNPHFNMKAVGQKLTANELKQAGFGRSSRSAMVRAGLLEHKPGGWFARESWSLTQAGKKAMTGEDAYCYVSPPEHDALRTAFAGTTVGQDLSTRQIEKASGGLLGPAECRHLARLGVLEEHPVGGFGFSFFSYSLTKDGFEAINQAPRLPRERTIEGEEAAKAAGEGDKHHSRLKTREQLMEQAEGHLQKVLDEATTFLQKTPDGKRVNVDRAEFDHHLGDLAGLMVGMTPEEIDRIGSRVLGGENWSLAKQKQQKKSGRGSSSKLAAASLITDHLKEQRDQTDAKLARFRQLHKDEYKPASVLDERLGVDTGMKLFGRLQGMKPGGRLSTQWLNDNLSERDRAWMVQHGLLKYRYRWFDPEEVFVEDTSRAANESMPAALRGTIGKPMKVVKDRNAFYVTPKLLGLVEEASKKAIKDRQDWKDLASDPERSHYEELKKKADYASRTYGEDFASSPAVAHRMFSELHRFRPGEILDNRELKKKIPKQDLDELVRRGDLKHRRDESNPQRYWVRKPSDNPEYDWMGHTEPPVEVVDPDYYEVTPQLRQKLQKIRDEIVDAEEQVNNYIFQRRRARAACLRYRKLAWQAADRGDAHSAALYVRQARALQYAWEKRGEVPGTKQFRWYNTDTKETRRQISEPGTSGRGGGKKSENGGVGGGAKTPATTAAKKAPAAAAPNKASPPKPEVFASQVAGVYEKSAHLSLEQINQQMPNLGAAPKNALVAAAEAIGMSKPSRFSAPKLREEIAQRIAARRGATTRAALIERPEEDEQEQMPKAQMQQIKKAITSVPANGQRIGEFFEGLLLPKATLGQKQDLLREAIAAGVLEPVFTHTHLATENDFQNPITLTSEGDGEGVQGVVVGVKPGRRAAATFSPPRTPKPLSPEEMTRAQDTVISFVEDAVARNSFDQPDFGRIYNELKDLLPAMTVGQFHDVLRGLAAQKRIHLAPWTGPIARIPGGIKNVALYQDHELKAYVFLPEGHQKKKKKQQQHDDDEQHVIDLSKLEPLPEEETVPDSKTVWRSASSAMKKIMRAKQSTGGIVTIPELIDAMQGDLAGSNLSADDIRDFLLRWQKEGRIVLQLANDKDNEPRHSEGIWTDRGLRFYVVFNPEYKDEGSSGSSKPPATSKPAAASPPVTPWQSPAVKQATQQVLSAYDNALGMTPESIRDVVNGLSNLNATDLTAVARNFEINRRLPNKKAYMEAIYAKIFGRLGSHLRAQQ